MLSFRKIYCFNFRKLLAALKLNKTELKETSWGNFEGLAREGRLSVGKQNAREEKHQGLSLPREGSVPVRPDAYLPS